MQTQNMPLVIVLLIVILVGSNLLMLGALWGFRSGKGFHLFGENQSMTSAWKRQADDLSELSQRVKQVVPPADDEEE